MANIIFLDNLDSFVYNLVDDIRQIGHSVTIFRNTTPVKIIIDALNQHPDSILCLSPGPGKPSDAGSMPELIKASVGKYPILGICLGHQAIIEHFGGDICASKTILHGESSAILHDGLLMFKGLENPLNVARYHSLIGSNIPQNLQINAHIDDIPMAVIDYEKKILGFQFHPESILTTQGYMLLKNSLNWLMIK